MKRAGWLAVVGAIGTLAGCGGKSSLPNITNDITIKAGVYGQTGSACDFGCSGVTPLVNQPIGVFSDLPWATVAAPIAFARTNNKGFFQFELAAGMYFVCTGYGADTAVQYTSCTDADVSTAPVGRTMIFNAGGEDWTGGTMTYRTP